MVLSEVATVALRILVRQLASDKSPRFFLRGHPLYEQRIAVGDDAKRLRHQRHVRPLPNAVAKTRKAERANTIAPYER